MALYRSIIPMNSSTSRCNDQFRAVCVLQCYSGIIENFQIVKNPDSAFFNGVVNLSCPSGTYVIGCHPHPNSDFSISYTDKYRKYYPASSTTCTCSDLHGIQCIATCASNVRNHEIKSATSNGTFLVSCSIPNQVLGCGMNPTGNGFEFWRSAFVFNSTACQCYDFFGTTCYAICGQIY